MSTPTPSTQPIKKHRRAVRLRIIAPVALPAFGLMALCIVLLVAAATDAIVEQRITTLMSMLATLFIALPTALLCAVMYLILAMTAVGAGWAYSHTRGPLRSARGLTERIAAKTEQLAPRVAQPFANMTVRLTRWEQTARRLGPAGLLPEPAPDEPDGQ
jgi:hypothetical protein